MQANHAHSEFAEKRKDPTVWRAKGTDGEEEVEVVRLRTRWADHHGRRLTSVADD